MERLMGIKNYVRQVRPVQEAHVNHLDRIQSFLSEDIDLPTDVLDGFEFSQTDKSEKSRVQIKVLSADRDTDRDTGRDRD